uniref:Uncharacterized protein n=1 Tax=Paramormyrops kingsleyae TaxID=1676925 RepID=A0A3B3S5H9_9TELE
MVVLLLYFCSVYLRKRLFSGPSPTITKDQSLPVPSLPGPAQNPIIGALLMADENTALDLTTRKDQRQPCGQGEGSIMLKLLPFETYGVKLILLCSSNSGFRSSGPGELVCNKVCRFPCSGTPTKLGN